MNAFLFSAIVTGYLALLIFCIIAPLVTIFRKEKRLPHILPAALLFLSEIIYTVIGPAIGFARFDEYGPDIPFSKHHVLIIILMVITSSASFWLAKLTANTTNPIIRIIVSVGLLQGLVLCGITTIHFLPYIPNGIMYPVLGFELLSPFISFLLLFREFYFYNKTELDLEELLPYREELGFIPLPLQILKQSIPKRLLIFSLLLIPVIALHILLAYGCGQDLDALVKAFTHSRGFIFSINN